MIATARDISCLSEYVDDADIRLVPVDISSSTEDLNPCSGL